MAVGIPSLTQLLRNEAAAVGQFVDLLRREQAALIDGLTDALADISGEKEVLAAQLAALSDERGAALAAEGCSADRAGLEDWLAKHPQQKEAAGLWRATLEAAATARELNRLNGELIRLRMQYNDQALAILLNKETPLDLYGPDGRSSGGENRRIDDAV